MGATIKEWAADGGAPERSFHVGRAISEFAAVPEAVIVHNPVEAGAFRAMEDGCDAASIESTFLYRSMPDSAAYWSQHDQLVAVLRSLIPEVLYLHEIAGDHDAYELTRSNPNHVFTRDSLITIPWIPGGYIAARMKPPQRREECILMEEAVRRLGLRAIVEVPEELFLEGGDVIPFAREGRRALLVGFGRRTSLEAVHFLHDQLAPHYVDEVFAVELAEWRMNLDGGLVPVAENVVVSDQSSIRRAMHLNHSGSREMDIFSMFRDLGMRVIDTTPEESVYSQSCNCVCVGNRTVVYYDLCKRVRRLLAEHDVRVVCVPGSELVKGRGGPRCMTRPIYRAPEEPVNLTGRSLPSS